MNPLLNIREWLILPDALLSMTAVLRAALDRGGFPGHSTSQTSELISVEDGIGVVSIHGPILRKPDLFARVFLGATDSEEIGSALQEASSRPDVKAVFLDIDSPGGTVLGTPELAAAVSSLNDHKPVYAFSSGLMCSAAYWIASQARAIYATPSAQVGSIGVVQTVVDDTAALENRGLKVEVFSVGKYKAMGAPGTTLTDDQREWIRSRLGEIASDFHAAVLAKGRSIPPEAMEGQTFSGKQAQRLNLAGMVPDRAEALRRLKVYHGSVDTRARAMSTAIEDELATARQELASLQRDYQAQAELLTEESAAASQLRSEVETQSAQVATLTAERDSALGQVTQLQARITELQASQADFDQRVQTEVARIVASTGTTTPAQVTPGTTPTASAAAGESIDQLVTEYTRLVDANQPEEAANFYHQHLAKHFNR